MEQTLGKRIVRHRKELGMTQDKLAEQLGITAQAVSKWENDQACPDITMLPKLAELFGTTTDSLLGMEAEHADPAKEAELVLEEEVPDSRSDGNRAFEMEYDGGTKSGVALALWVILTGGLLLTSALLDWGAGFWDILWPSGLLIFGVFGLFPRFSFFRLGCGLFGAFFLLQNLNVSPFRFGKELFFSVFLLLFGMSLLADALKSGKKSRFSVFHHGKPVFRQEGGKTRFASYCQESDAHFECSTSFGSDHRKLTAERISSGEISLCFGELTVDLTGCGEIADRCRITADCSFGELTILIPENCRVEYSNDSTFAEISVEGAPAPDSNRVILLECSANFGEIEICYI